MQRLIVIKEEVHKCHIVHQIQILEIQQFLVQMDFSGMDKFVYHAYQFQMVIALVLLPFHVMQSPATVIMHQTII